jgi:gamma-glutamylcyclotransferase (GGCT)/AIG2-like uncharacterized protein YtfP
MNLLFVYGTLCRSFDNLYARELRDNSRLIGRACAKGSLYLVGPYPGFVPGGEGLVYGELVELFDPAETLPLLDIYEGCSPVDKPPYEFERVTGTVITEDGQSHQVWMYVYRRPVDGLERITSGVFEPPDDEG